MAVKSRSYRQRELEFKVHAGGFRFGQVVILYRDAIKRLGFAEGHSPAMMIEIILMDEEQRGLVNSDPTEM